MGQYHLRMPSAYGHHRKAILSGCYGEIREIWAVMGQPDGQCDIQVARVLNARSTPVESTSNCQKIQHRSVLVIAVAPLVDNLLQLPHQHLRLTQIFILKEGTRT